MSVEGYNSPPPPSKQSPHPLKVLENAYHMAASTLQEIDQARHLSQQFSARVKRLSDLVNAGRLPDRRFDGQLTLRPTGFGIEIWPNPLSSEGSAVVTLPYKISNAYRYRLFERLGICSTELGQSRESSYKPTLSTNIPGIIVVIRRHPDWMLIGWEFKSSDELIQSLARYR